MVMAGDNNDAPAEQPTIDVDVGNLVIKADSKYTQSAWHFSYRSNNRL